MAEGKLGHAAGLRVTAGGEGAPWGAEQPQFRRFLLSRDKAPSLQPVVVDGGGSGWVCGLFCTSAATHSVSFVKR